MRGYLFQHCKVECNKSRLYKIWAPYFLLQMFRESRQMEIFRMRIRIMSLSVPHFSVKIITVMSRFYVTRI